MTVNQRDTYQVEFEHGFHEHVTNPLFVPTKLALIISECAEALEWHRAGRLEQMAGELADIVIRTMNLAEYLGVDLDAAVKAKHEFNKTRAMRHGGKLY